MLSEGSVSPLLKRKSLMTKSPSFWFGHLGAEDVCATAAGAAIASRAARVGARARKVIGILQMGPLGARARPAKAVPAAKATLFWRRREGAAGASLCGNAGLTPARPRKS